MSDNQQVNVGQDTRRWILPEWQRLIESMPLDKPVTSTEAWCLCAAWRSSRDQLAHALRKMADYGLLDKPARGKFVRPGDLTILGGWAERATPAPAQGQENEPRV